MEEYVLFKKIATWMLSKQGVKQEDVIKMAGINERWYKELIKLDKETLFEMPPSFRAMVQTFVRKHYHDYIVQKGIEELPDEIPHEEKIESAEQKKKEHIDYTTIEAQNDLLYNPQRNERRKKERAQEKIFNEQLQRLRDVTPDHMSFDIILKHK